MSRFKAAFFAIVLVAAFSVSAFAADGGSKFISGSGNLLRGVVYKNSGAEREGLLTIRTNWVLPAPQPVFRYDFDFLFGRIENKLYKYYMGDIAELEFLPLEGGNQPVNIKLRNGLVQKIILSTDRKSILGEINLRLDEVDVITDGYGENKINGGDIHKIVFLPPAKPEDETAASLTSLLGNALQIGERDGLVDDDFMIVLKNIQKKLKDKTNGEVGK